MRKIILIITLFFVPFSFSACSPVLTKEVIKDASTDVPFSVLRESPSGYKGNLYLLGGIIAHTRLTHEGSLIEALYVPVDSRGYLKDTDTSHVRFLALFPKERGILDPIIFKPHREITIAAVFSGTRKAKIDEMDYTYPFFRITGLYLWEEKKYYPFPYYAPYPYWWNYPYWDRPYPYGWRHRVPPYYWW